MVLGARMPIALTSRADGPTNRVASALLALLAAHNARRNHAPQGWNGTQVRKAGSPMAILAVNAGHPPSSSPSTPAGREVPQRAQWQHQGWSPAASPRWAGLSTARHTSKALAAGAGSFFARALAALRTCWPLRGVPRIAAVAHRVVHGGADFRTSVHRHRRGAGASLAKLNSLAPLHQPHNLEGIRAFREAFPELPQVACFDTAFHATLPMWITPLPAPG
jgi:acetate kinase